MRRFENAKALATQIGHDIGASDWMVIDQATIDAFARTTGDYQWIHTDPVRAAQEGPGGKTIAHGYLTLSLIASLMPQILEVEASRVLNVGANKLRFLAPVPVGSKVRLVLGIKQVEEASGGIRVTAGATMEIADEDKPALVAELVFLYFD